MARTSTVQAAVFMRCSTMKFLSFTALLLAASLGGGLVQARATEVPALQAGETLASLGQPDRARVEQALRRESLAPVGDVRRKGQVIVIVAVQHGIPWRIVIDGPSGEIIGRRPLPETVALPR
jgi:hypothetical protein